MSRLRVLVGGSGRALPIARASAKRRVWKGSRIRHAVRAPLSPRGRFDESIRRRRRIIAEQPDWRCCPRAQLRLQGCPEGGVLPRAAAQHWEESLCGLLACSGGGEDELLAQLEAHMRMLETSVAQLEERSMQAREARACARGVQA